jgi:tetratricopeptide (TPR) repeat protein
MVRRSSRRGGRLAALCTALALLVSTAPAAAQPSKKPPPQKLDAKTAEAKRLFDEGAELYTRGSYEEAISAWEKSYELSKKPLIFESIANAYERLGQPKKARDYLSRWRAVAPDDEHELLDARIKKLDERIARDDALAEAKRVEEEKARRQREEEERRRQGQRPSKPGGDRGPGLLGPGLALAGAGVGAVVVGITLDVIAQNRRPDESTACAQAGDRQLCKKSEADAIESSNTLALVGDVIWIVGAAAVAGGVVLIVLDAPDKTDEGATTLAPSFGPHGGGVRLGRTF